MREGKGCPPCRRGSQAPTFEGIAALISASILSGQVIVL